MTNTAIILTDFADGTSARDHWMPKFGRITKASVRKLADGLTAKGRPVSRIRVVKDDPTAAVPETLVDFTA